MDDEPLTPRAAFYARAIPVFEYLLTQDMHGKATGVPVEHGDYYGVAVWSVVYTTDQGQYRIWVAPVEGAWAWANDGEYPGRMVGCAAFSTPEAFGSWVLGQILIIEQYAAEDAQAQADAARMLGTDKGPSHSA